MSVKNVIPSSVRQLILRNLPDEFVASMFRVSYAQRHRELTNRIRTNTNETVQSGPFASMIIPGEAGDCACKLLGFYEIDIVPVIEEIAATAPDVVINVGCADGYYAVGLARLLPAAKVYAFDRSQYARDFCQRMAEANGVAGRLQVEGLCTTATLSKLAQGARAPFVLIDIEGGECELLSNAASQLANATLLIECHDFVDRSITRRLLEEFVHTHEARRINQGPRNPHDMRILGSLPEDDRWMMISEHRPEPMHWLLLSPGKAQQSA